MKHAADTAGGTLQIGDLSIHRLGFGAMRLTGKGIWGEPQDRNEAIRVLRRAVELGVNFIDTADSYGPGISEEIISEALYPYPDDVVICGKGGRLRTAPTPGEWPNDGRPGHLRQGCEASLRGLRPAQVPVF